MLAAALALLLAGCGKPQQAGGNDTWGPTYDTCFFEVDASMDCGWDADGFWIEISSSCAPSYALGLAETGCDGEGSAPGGACWTGEDCLAGFVAEDGTTTSTCHPVSIDGTRLERVDSPDQVLAGQLTLHRASPHNTYMLTEGEDGDCWVWGADTSWFATLGCRDIGPGCRGDDE